MKKQRTMKFKDFEIRPMRFIDGHTDPKIWEVVKWCRCEPREVIDVETGKKKISDTYCFAIAFLNGMKKSHVGKCVLLVQDFLNIMKKV